MIKTLDLSPALKESKSQLHRQGEKSCHRESGQAMAKTGPSSQRERALGWEACMGSQSQGEGQRENHSHDHGSAWILVFASSKITSWEGNGEDRGRADMFHHHLSLVCLRMTQPGQNGETLVCSL